MQQAIWGALPEDDSGSAIDAEALTAAFETGNGESIVLMYNPNCVPDQEISPASITTDGDDWLKYVCVNMVYDLNNNKGPNTVGKDIGFMTVFYPTDSVVVSTVPDLQTVGADAADDGSSAGTIAVCRDTEYRVPNKFESMSIALNNKLVDGTDIGDSTKLVTSSKGADASDTYVYVVEGKELKAVSGGTPAGVTRCVKR